MWELIFFVLAAFLLLRFLTQTILELLAALGLYLYTGLAPLTILVVCTCLFVIRHWREETP